VADIGVVVEVIGKIATRSSKTHYFIQQKSKAELREMLTQVENKRVQRAKRVKAA
jgi:uncharacterized membrane-anchored protein YhcB (DUF1043 family)